ncbi:MAG: hypothetical protein M0R41_17070 [Methylobacter tundripaludum]|nr:hypothetical protein [Methylobacter tundripaludum]
MQAIEFETIAHGHTIRIPDTVPDGVRLQVRLLLDEDAAVAMERVFPEEKNVKNHPPQSIKQLKGIAPKPGRVVSLEEMDAAIQLEGAKR